MLSKLIVRVFYLIRLLVYKMRWFSNLHFSWSNCWRIRIKSGFEIWQFSLPNRLSIHLGSNVTIEKDVWFKGSAQLIIGDNTLIGRRTIIGCNEKIEIGEDCLFAENVRIQDTDHCFENIHIPIRELCKISPHRQL